MKYKTPDGIVSVGDEVLCGNFEVTPDDSDNPNLKHGAKSYVVSLKELKTWEAIKPKKKKRKKKPVAPDDAPTTYEPTIIKEVRTDPQVCATAFVCGVGIGLVAGMFMGAAVCL